MATRFRHLLPALNRLASAGARVDLEQVGTDVCLSPTRAQRVFRDQIGESPKQFQRRVRLQRAAIMLLASDARIVDVAVASGFESHEAFTRAFRRHFDTSPSHYRNQHDRWPERDSISVATRTAPCVGLMRRRLDGQRRPTTPLSITRRQDDDMASDTPEINRRDLADIPVLFGTRKLDQDKVAEGLAEVLPAAFGYAMAQGLAMSGPPFVRYINYGPASFTVEAGVQLVEPAEPPPEDSTLSAGVIPASTVATCVHKGPYESLRDTYQAIEKWIDTQGLSPAGPPWEVYLTDPTEVPDPTEWLTEINWPIV